MSSVGFKEEDPVKKLSSVITPAKEARPQNCDDIYVTFLYHNAITDRLPYVKCPSWLRAFCSYDADFSYFETTFHGIFYP